MAKIQPTIGRVIWFARERGQTEPFAAMIAFVHPQEPGAEYQLVNVRYMDHNADSHKAMNVPLVNYGQNPPAEGPCCTWMPYQVGQAAKTEAVLASVAAEEREIEQARRNIRQAAQRVADEAEAQGKAAPQPNEAPGS